MDPYNEEQGSNVLGEFPHPASLGARVLGDDLPLRSARLH